MTTIHVYIHEHDDDDIRFAVNDSEDERGNFADLIVDGLIDEDTHLDDYLGGIPQLDMPIELFFEHPSEASISWLEAHL